MEQPRFASRLTDKGRAVLRALDEAEVAMAAIWREPFETYDVSRRCDWTERQRQAERVYLAVRNQI